MSTTLEVRIDAEAKEAARQRAQAQGYTLSEGVRQLLALWVEGAIDLAVIDRARLETLPKMKELRELAHALLKLRDSIGTVGGAVSEAEDTVNAILFRYGGVLKGLDQRPVDDMAGLPPHLAEVFQRAILGRLQ